MKKGFTLKYLKMLKLIISIRKISKIPLTFLALEGAEVKKIKFQNKSNAKQPVKAQNQSNYFMWQLEKNAGAK